MPVVQINGIGMHYQESGDRDTPTIVFAHPLMWGPDAFAELLTEIARDARLCYGRSPWPWSERISGSHDTRRDGGRSLWVAASTGARKRSRGSDMGLAE